MPWLYKLFALLFVCLVHCLCIFCWFILSEFLMNQDVYKKRQTTLPSSLSTPNSSVASVVMYSWRFAISSVVTVCLFTASVEKKLLAPALFRPTYRRQWSTSSHITRGETLIRRVRHSARALCFMCHVSPRKLNEARWYYTSRSSSCHA